jgi:outer membrane protein assembly factor BamD
LRNLIKSNAKNIILLFLIATFFNACASKQVEEFNKPALYWYNKMIKEISLNQLERADNTYTSLESEHRNSPLLPSALMVIAITHMDEEEYEVAVYYFDEYIKKFENNSLQDYVRYLKIKAKFLAFKQQFREQKLMDDTLVDINYFVANHPDSSYLFLVKTMQSRLYMAKASLNTEIASLYERINKPKASKVYANKAKTSWSEIKDIEPVSVSWYRTIFE